MQSFSELGVSARIVRSLSERAIQSPFPIQERVLPDALAGRDILAKAPTGSGKTIAFAIPLVERLEPGDARPAALVLVPTRELASQVAVEIASLASKGVEVATVYGGVPIHAQAKRARRAHVLVATPGRLNDLLERKAISLEGVRPSFSTRPTACSTWASSHRSTASCGSFRARGRRCSSPRRSTRASVSSRTRTPRIAVRCEAAPRAEDDGDVEHRFISVKPDDKIATLAGLLQEDRGLALVFVRTRRGADRLVKKLVFHQIDAVALHGDLSQGQRERALRRFESGHATTLVATDVAARGLDLVDITHVINFDPPAEHSGYVHRVGRTGRAGRTGTGITLVLPDQQADVSRVARLAGHTEQFASGGMTVAPPRRVYSSRRGRSKWGTPAPRRKI